jgi:hypothetical protein
MIDRFITGDILALQVRNILNAFLCEDINITVGVPDEKFIGSFIK